jgi:restriction system protein
LAATSVGLRIFFPSLASSAVQIFIVLAVIYLLLLIPISLRAAGLKQKKEKYEQERDIYREQCEAFNLKIQKVIEKHKSALVRLKSQLVWQDAYGEPQFDKWISEQGNFVTKYIAPSLDKDERAIFDVAIGMIFADIDSAVDLATKKHSFSKDVSQMTPWEFESFCADVLRTSGWECRVTSQSHDQGVDVIAELKEARVVIQCKLYSRPVGNKAVQEAVAAKAFENATHAAVVTNNRYTPAAEQLAHKNNVLLLHYRDLRELDTKIFQGRGNTAQPVGSPEFRR